MFLVVGLGNPGDTYEGTRHNVGFIFLDNLAAECQIQNFSGKFRSLYAKGAWKCFDLVLLKPQTFMNLSGSGVQDALAFFKLPPEKLIVICDDLDQASGAVRMRFGGSHGGHNGLRDIIAKLGTDKFYRIKVGIGKPQYKQATADWVLSRFSSEERLQFDSCFSACKDRLLSILKQESKN